LSSGFATVFSALKSQNRCKTVIKRPDLPASAGKRD
jgi:hypothetical protein